MALQSSGQISLNDLHVEAGGTSGTQASMNDSDIRGLLNASANSQMTFSGFYGASAATTLLSGNSTHVANGQYNPESFFIAAQTPHASMGAYGSPYAASTFFTLNGRNTYCANFTYLPSTNRFVLNMADFAGGPQSTPSGYPSNAGWSSVILSGNGSTQTFTRSSASYVAGNTYLYINGSTSQTMYASAMWQWTSGTNIFPSSNNTTSFTLAIS